MSSSTNTLARFSLLDGWANPMPTRESNSDFPGSVVRAPDDTVPLADDEILLQLDVQGRKRVRRDQVVPLRIVIIGLELHG